MTTCSTVEDDLTIELLPSPACITISCWPTTRERVIQVLSSYFACDMPTECGDVRRVGHQSVTALSPDSWIVLTPPDDQKAVIEDFERLLPAAQASLVDLSSAFVTFRLSGHRAQKVLQSELPIDLQMATRPTAFCVSSVMWHIPVVVYAANSTRFEIHVGTSYSEHYGQLLRVAASETPGVNFAGRS